jgi:peroxidase
VLLETVKGRIESEKESPRSFGMRNFKYVNTIKDAVEKECPLTVSCADIVSLSARDGIVMVRTTSLSLSRPSKTIFNILGSVIYSWEAQELK